MALGKRSTIPAKMMSEIPLPTPFSVICSPNHITNIVPAARVSTVVTKNIKDGLTTADTPPAPSTFVMAKVIIAPCKTARNSAKIRVIWFSFLLPDSPSLCILSNAGKICAPRTSPIIMDALMYGIIPKAKMENLPNAPPEKIFIKPRIPFWWAAKSCFKTSALIPGIGIAAAIRKTANAPIKKRSLFLSSGALKIFATVLLAIIWSSVQARLRCRRLFQSPLWRWQKNRGQTLSRPWSKRR